MLSVIPIITHEVIIYSIVSYTSRTEQWLQDQVNSLINKTIDTLMSQPKKTRLSSGSYVSLLLVHVCYIQTAFINNRNNN